MDSNRPRLQGKPQSRVTTPLGTQDQGRRASPPLHLKPDSGEGSTRSTQKSNGGGIPLAKEKGKLSLKPSLSHLNPLSSVFQPSKSTEMTVARVRDNGPETHAYESDNPRSNSLSRLSLQSNASTIIATPTSQMSFAQNSPSPGMTWTTGSIASQNPYTPPLPANATYDNDTPGSFAPRLNGSRFERRWETAGEENPGRFLIITNIPKSASGEDVRDVVKDIAPYRAIIVKLLKTKGWVIAVFYDARDSKRVYNRLCQSPVVLKGTDSLAQLECATVEEDVVRQLAGSGKELDQILKATESVIRVQVNGHHGVDIGGMETCLRIIGELKEFKAHGLGGKSFTAEFYDTRRAAEAIRLLHNQPVEAGMLRAVYRSEDPFQSEPVAPTRTPMSQAAPLYTLGSAAFMASPSSTSQRSVSNLASNSLFDRYHGIFAPLDTNPTQPPFGQLTGNVDRLSIDSEHNQILSKAAEWQPWGSHTDLLPHQAQAIPRQITEPAALQGLLNQMDISARARQRQGWTAADRQAIPEENRVHPERILHGYDPRTTVMIKDVPNKLSRQELVNILQEVVPDEFDFVYLRFDFNNHCNVGYAFVNFTSTKALYNFILAKVGKKWNMFSSEKVLQVSYANIQGKAALVNKFRNSAVMDVIEEWRPQIFYSNGTFKGKPEPFPEADNVAIRHRAASARLSFLSGAGPTKPLESGDRMEYDYSSAPSSSTLYGF